MAAMCYARLPFVCGRTLKATSTWHLGFLRQIAESKKSLYASSAVRRCFHSLKRDLNRGPGLHETNCRTIKEIVGNKELRSRLLYRTENRLLLLRYSSGVANSSWKTDSVLYLMSFTIFMVGGAYTAVPLYKMFCRVSVSPLVIYFMIDFSSKSKFYGNFLRGPIMELLCLTCNPINAV